MNSFFNLFKGSSITGIFGKMGNGKTMLLAYLGVALKENGYNINSNFHLKTIDYNPIETLEDVDNVRDGVLLLDEMQLWVHARSGMSKLNQDLLRIIMMSRKRGLILFYTSQLYRTVDVLLREVTDYIIMPNIIPIRQADERGKPTDKVLDFALCFQMFDIYKNPVCSIALKKPLDVYGSWYDTKEEIKSLTRGDPTSLEKGIQLEETFSKALKKVKRFNHVEIIPNSGIHSSWSFDVIGYTHGKTLAFDVKGSCRDRVYLNSFGKSLSNKITNAKSHNAVPYIAFPRNDRVQLSNPNYWFICPLNQYSYLLTLSSNPAYKKLVENSQKLVEI